MADASTDAAGRGVTREGEPVRVLGIEGTAWCASAAVYDGERDDFRIESDAYEPESGGIHPREAAEHMHDAIPRVVETALDWARERHDGDGPPVDAVAFSRGPGLGPCLRIVGTAARALARSLAVPLVGANHMVAHLEIGRHQSGFASPVCLNASGANAHLLGYRDGRYRVLGETMDTGVGNAIDKFTRHVGWTHPGGPKVEERARDGEYVELPYVVKGMDFSFSGIMSAAKQAYDDGVPVEDVCRGLEETIFAMLAEVTERALSLTGSDELVLGGGVAQNARLTRMLREMCDARGAEFYAPEPRFLRDNAGMIALLGAKMYAAGDTLPIEDSSVDANFRPDEVPVTWRDGEDVTIAPESGAEIRGAEAVVDVGDVVTKRRVPKLYRHPELDERLRATRTRSEARLTHAARAEGVPTPVVREIDDDEGTLVFERVGDCDLAHALTPERVRAVGEHLAAIHAAGFVHGDPTTRNVRVAPDARDTDTGDGSDGDDAGGERAFLIDFGLGYHSEQVEDYAMDLHVFDQSLVGTATDPDPLRAAVRDGYRDAGDDRVLDQLAAIEGRGRYQ
ncbi:bifunctional N(6)-L-threonylcarbamoyladenine synthase/serine/threonine protein kinase [Halorubellus sp. JP-L1]|uniref:bifunctional N(6)-L-threonylcarbamoyladenine synthase/serine/threonine protein kinase n=1 Tax=Halorubellus sp. JP-L1 TaxID=2715753 RepID=UPI001408A2A5|nr:bifunctional N(6)-L-threonylcarbamoyladenine synthase/serine/threonine protein kinase [Halorubellus sp. JP-L1]NHN42066.1 bifunctional N(6)-L-threonylcarbamoyladenine synthase/serine/threonine protein kinase [Halorubellus sp. JP-L1]